MAGDGPAPARTLAGFQNDHRFAAFFGTQHKFPAFVFAEAFDVEGDHPRGRVLRQIIEELQFAQDGLVSDADGLGESHPLFGKFDQLIHKNAPALADEGYVPDGGLDHALGRQEEGVDVRRNVDPEAVGADERKRGLARYRDDPLLQVPPAAFGESP